MDAPVLVNVPNDGGAGSPIVTEAQRFLKLLCCPLLFCWDWLQVLTQPYTVHGLGCD